MPALMDSQIVEALLDFGKSIDPKELFPTFVPAATEFALGNKYGFALAVCLDRGAKSDIIWTIPYYINQQLGHLDPWKMNSMNLGQLRTLFNQLPHRPRYIRAAPRTTKELTQLVVDRFEGDASRIWTSKRAAQVNQTFQGIWGVASGIANMSVLLIEKAYGIQFSDLDRPTMDIKADVNTMRVLYRLGLSVREDEQVAMQAARRLHPEYPGEIDAPLWVIGRRWCFKYSPRCSQCRMNKLCSKIGL